MKTRSSLVFLILVGIIVSGCAPKYTYSKSGTSSAQRTQDDYECERENMYTHTSYSSGYLIQTRKVNPRGWKKCMQGRGYTVRTRSN